MPYQNTERKSSFAKDILYTVLGGVLFSGLIAAPIVFNPNLYEQCEQVQEFSPHHKECNPKDPIIRLNNFLYGKWGDKN